MRSEMNTGILKMSGKEMASSPVREGPWKGSHLAEAFPADGSTKMSCGIHTIPPSRTTALNPVADDVLYILDGEMDILSEGVTAHFEKGDFAYLPAGVPRTFIVHREISHVYVTYPCRWK
jgi:ethanolamine utilization protein EutQ (cupin superfamily)